MVRSILISYVLFVEYGIKVCKAPHISLHFKFIEKLKINFWGKSIKNKKIAIIWPGVKMAVGIFAPHFKVPGFWKPNSTSDSVCC